MTVDEEPSTWITPQSDGYFVKGLVYYEQLTIQHVRDVLAVVKTRVRKVAIEGLNGEWTNMDVKEEVAQQNVTVSLPEVNLLSPTVIDDLLKKANSSIHRFKERVADNA